MTEFNKNLGFVICEQCNGTGKDEETIVCLKCKGEGKLTWIENIFGRQSTELINIPVGTILPFTEHNHTFNKNQNIVYKIKVESALWFIADGSVLNKKHFPELFNVIGYSYGGSGDKFFLPDYRAKIIKNNNNITQNHHHHIPIQEEKNTIPLNNNIGDSHRHSL